MKIAVSFDNCERCGGTHSLLGFEPLTKPIVYEGLVAFTHWALCPNTGEPILIESVAEGKENKIECETRAKIVCLCGSTRFIETFQSVNLAETLAGHIVLSIGCNTQSDLDLFAKMHENELRKLKLNLRRLHFQKIDLADEVLVLNVGDYIGEDTQLEIDYARQTGKPIRYLEPHAISIESWKENL